MWPEPNRFTPYFLPHSTDIGALTTILSGDDRFFNNIFSGWGDREQKDRRQKAGLSVYDNAKLPVWISDNLYLNGATPSSFDKSMLSDPGFDPSPGLVEIDGSLYLDLNINELFFNKVRIINTQILGKAKIPKASFDNTDWSDLAIDHDYQGILRTQNNNLAGPFTNLSGSKVILRVW